MTDQPAEKPAPLRSATPPARDRAGDESVPETDAGDAFASFSPAPEEKPRGARKAARIAGRVLTHEWTLAGVGSVLLAVLMTWPTMKYPEYTIPQDLGDPTLQAWQMAWSGHILTTSPAELWNSNSFFPEKLSFAFSDTLLGYAPAGMIGSGIAGAILRYNIMFVLLHALAFFGAYALARQLGSGKTGAAVAGMAFAYAPWRLAQGGHMHVISTGGIALALAMLARGHGWSLRDGYRPDRRKPGWALAGWLVAAWQITLGFGIGLPFGYVLGFIALGVAGTIAVRAIAAKRRGKPTRPFGGRLLAADLGGGLVFALVTVMMALPYLQVAAAHGGARRSEGDVALYSPPILGFFVSPAQSMIWGESHQAVRDSLTVGGEMSLLPGFVLYGLAVAGLILSIWTLRQRLLLLAGVVLSIILAMGTAFFGGRPGYMTLYDILPGLDAIRTPGRLVVWTTLLLGLLAAGAITAFIDQLKQISADRVTSRPHPALRLVTIIPVVLVMIEGLNVTEHPVMPLQPASLATAKGPMLVLPSDALMDMKIMLWSTDRFEPIVNGNSGFTPQTLSDVRSITVSFPDQPSIAKLRELGVKTVVVLKAEAKGTPYEPALTIPVDGLGITREEHDDAVVFTLDG